jgi:hypothetical protein
MAASNDKFHEADLPKILEAIKEARELNIPSTVTIVFAANGGVISIRRDSKKDYK